jgi:hypothetical protein
VFDRFESALNRRIVVGPTRQPLWGPCLALATSSADVAAGLRSPRPRRLPTVVSEAPPAPSPHGRTWAGPPAPHCSGPGSPSPLLSPPCPAHLEVPHSASPLPLSYLLSSPVTEEMPLRQSRSHHRRAPSRRAISTAYSTRCHPVSSFAPRPARSSPRAPSMLKTMTLLHLLH